MSEGARAAGAAAVVARLAAVAEMHAAYGAAAYDLDAPDAQALQARRPAPARCRRAGGRVGAGPTSAPDAFSLLG